MRGAALKIGQMLSIQDETVLPPQVRAQLQRVVQAYCSALFYLCCLSVCEMLCCKHALLLHMSMSVCKSGCSCRVLTCCRRQNAVGQAQSTLGQ
jgi:hypothetical protein